MSSWSLYTGEKMTEATRRLVGVGVRPKFTQTEVVVARLELEKNIKLLSGNHSPEGVALLAELREALEEVSRFERQNFGG